MEGTIIDVWNDGLSEMRRAVDVDLREDLQFPLTYQIADIREPQSRKSDSSKTVTVPGTRGNDQLFAQLFEIGADSTFDVNRKRDCFVLQDGIQVFEGSIRLRKIARNDWNTVSYDTMMVGRLADLFSALKNDRGLDLRLTDLDFSEWSHLRTRDSILDSWVGTLTRGGSAFQSYAVGPTYSVVDTGFAPGGRTIFNLGSTHSLALGDVVRFEMDFPGSTTVAFDQSNGHHTVVDLGATSVTVNLAFTSGATNSGVLSLYRASGLGYVYPTVNLGKSSLTDTMWMETDYVPSLYARTIVDAIFDRLGFTFESEFFDSDYFKRLVVYGGTAVSTPGRIATQNDATGATSTYSRLRSVMDGSPGVEWTVDETLGTGEYTYFNATGATLASNLHFSVRITEGYPGALSQVFLATRAFRNFNAGGGTDSSWAAGFGNGNDGAGAGSPTVFTVINTGVTGPNTSYVAPGVIQVDKVWNYTFRPYERVRIVWQLVPGSLSQFANTLYLTYAGDTEDAVVPPDMLARDFLIFLINAFNLYVDPDRQNERNVVIEPFDLYYGPGTPLDWTGKVDVSQQVDIEPVSPEMARRYLLSYQDDTDFQNKGYKDAYQETYGQIEVDRDNYFNNSTQEIRVPVFAATPLVDTRGGAQLVLPTIVKDAQWTRVEAFKPRLLYFTGLRNSSLGFSVGLTGGTGGGATGGTAWHTRDVYGTDLYGYGGHLDNPLDATLDLDFGLLRQYYYGGGVAFYVAQDGLYNRFYRRWLDELTDPETRRVTFSMKLTPMDLADLSFRRIYQVQGTNFRLQKIDDYNPLTGEPCRVEFLKIKQSPAYNFGATALGVGVNPTQGTGTVPPLPGDNDVGGNVVPIGAVVGNVEVLGTGNTVLTSDAVLLVGYDNRVENSSTVLVLGRLNKVH